MTIDLMTRQKMLNFLVLESNWQ